MAANAKTATAGVCSGVNQADARPGMVDLGPGYLDPALLPTDLMRHCTTRALARWGAQTLGYGANAGPMPLRAALAQRVVDAGAARCTADNVLATGGTSAALDQLAVRLASAGRPLLTEALTYDLGKLIFEGRGVPTVAVPGPLDDVDVAAFDRAAHRAEREYGQPPALYLIPTFHNPTGRVLGTARRRELIALAERRGLLIIEDQAYADLNYGPPPPPSLWTCSADPDRVVTLYSFAKCLAPGLRVGWLVTGEHLVAELAADPVRHSGGGPNHFTTMAVTAACLEGEFDRHLDALREELRLRRDTLLAAVIGRLPDGYNVSRPDGGFFVWIGLPTGVKDVGLLRAAERRGVSITVGRRFGAARGVRVCFAACGPAELRLGAARLVAACAPRSADGR